MANSISLGTQRERQIIAKKPNVRLYGEKQRNKRIENMGTAQ